jgi:aerobic-type carbon monoxide dehydrogenase small subunit (CoxS/CutS family)
VLGPDAVPLTLKINGAVKTVTVEPRVTLLRALRNHLDLTGAKEVCDRAAAARAR